MIFELRQSPKGAQVEDMGRGHSSNDQRSISMNRNNQAYQSSQDNRSNQMNHNNSAYYSSRCCDYDDDYEDDYDDD